jgi:DNA topoisomerase-3
METRINLNNSTFSSSSLRLVIAEKSSVAQSLSAVLGATQRKDGYLEGNGYIVSYCVGHLVQMAAPDAYDPKYTKWRREDLPIVPDRWQYTVTESTKKQFNVLKKSLSDNRVTSVVCATDAGREGELIFRLVYEMCNCRKPIERLWISSLEETAIQKGFRELQPGSAYDRLYQAALCRAQADWLVGLNITRILSTVYNQTLNVGRVMTPTLALVTAREAAVASFQPATFYTVGLDCGDFTATSEKYAAQAEADHIAAQCHGKSCAVQQAERKVKTEKPPRLYDLTTLQREANRLHGFTAQQTLDYTQSLYEKKLCTYPRTDSQFLPENMRENAITVLDAAASVLPFAQRLPPVHDVDQILNDKKVTDHHAIIPTAGVRGRDPASLPHGESVILMLLIARLVCAAGAPHEYAETTVRFTCEGIPFTARGNQIIRAWWRSAHAIFHTGKQQDDSGEQEPPLPPMREGDAFSPVITSVKQGKTSPPKRFTEDSLLAAMERAGTAEAPADAEHKGLGTPATRAATIEKLVRSGFIERKGEKKTKALLPTQKGIALIAVAPESIQSPLLTAEWEHKLKQVEQGTLAADVFLSEITALLRELTRTYGRSADAGVLFPSSHKVVGPCPRCDSSIIEKPKGFFCDNAACGLAIWRNNYFFAAQKKEVTAEFVTALLQDGRVLMRNLHSQKTGKPYDAYLLLDPASEKNARFKIELVKKDGQKNKAQLQAF